ncbi:MAG: replication-associated recombination protein A [Ignavibacteria bacterium]|nr:replication-associated recombination protein A [Ignavibacteria bacterium]
MDLFDSAQNSENFPLAERLRPSLIEDYVGQKHLIGQGKPIRIMIEKNDISSMILWGPPGTGKTTLALLISYLVNLDFRQLSAVSSGVKDVRAVLEEAEKNLKYSCKKTILFIDEIHRFNKAQQDSLLHSVEKGSIILIGATTENPSFEVISPLLSRSRVYVLEELSKSDLMQMIDTALTKDEYLSKMNIEIPDKDFLIKLSGGDGRRLLNGLELAVKLTYPDANGKIILTNEILKETYQTNYIKYDKNAEEHYNIISAFIKSMRGSDPDAALYWMAKMLKGGEDPKFICRRMVILASEDVGNADPNALTMAMNCFNAINVIGMPEGRIIMGQTAVYLASAPKSNASYAAIEKAFEDVNKYPDTMVPLHLRNAPTKLMKELNYGKDYNYAHSFDNHFIDDQYLPDEVKDKIYYKPGELGKEKEIKERLEALWKDSKHKNYNKTDKDGN